MAQLDAHDMLAQVGTEIQRGAEMNRYRLSYIMHEPSEDTEDKFMAEIPALPGCRSWGDSPAETLYILEGVAQAFIQSYLEGWSAIARWGCAGPGAHWH